MTLATNWLRGEGGMMAMWIKKDFRRGGSYPPPEVRHGTKPLNRVGRVTFVHDGTDYNLALNHCQSIKRACESKTAIVATTCLKLAYVFSAKAQFALGDKGLPPCDRLDFSPPYPLENRR